MRAASVLLRNRKATPFSVYIHWPYCESKCTYCNFNKYVQPITTLPDERLKKAMEKEIDYYVNQYQLHPRPIHSIYFGGGTPSKNKIRVGLCVCRADWLIDVLVTLRLFFE
jgi:coproporphyrinogen III oxidase-like Fe-S oxidoreductase